MDGSCVDTPGANLLKKLSPMVEDNHPTDCLGTGAEGDKEDYGTLYDAQALSPAV
jgi:hypothetical protein